jgi:hypothetical protein
VVKTLSLKVAVIGFFKNMESAEAQAFAKAAEAVDDQVRSILLSLIWFLPHPPLLANICKTSTCQTEIRKTRK